MKRIIAIGGGELRERTTLQIDEYIATLAKARAGEKRANALFIPTASHDFMPYYNTFHKVYTGIFDIKTDVALTVFKDVDMEKMRAKFEKADVIYVGGGDTVFMMESWKKTGLLPRQGQFAGFRISIPTRFWRMATGKKSTLCFKVWAGKKA